MVDSMDMYIYADRMSFSPSIFALPKWPGCRITPDVPESWRQARCAEPLRAENADPQSISGRRHGGGCRFLVIPAPTALRSRCVMTPVVI